MREIKKGDLVQVIRSHCDGFEQAAAGAIFTVDSFVQANGLCSHCRQEMTAMFAEDAAPKGWRIPVQYLKRIPPLSELEGERRDEEITA